MRGFLLAVVGALVLFGCGGGGQPLEGDLAGSFKGKAFEATSGVAIHGGSTNPAGMFLMMGDGAVDCGNASSSPPDGTYVVVSLAAVQAGTFGSPDAQIFVEDISSTHLEAIGAAGTDDITIDSVDGGRVSGNLMMDAGGGTNAKGTFTVFRCF